MKFQQNWQDFGIEHEYSCAKFLQGSVVTQTMLGGLTYVSSCCTFPVVQCTSAKNYENRLSVDKVIAVIKRVQLF